MLTDEQIEQILFKYTSNQGEFSLSVIKVIAERLSRLADFDSLISLESSLTMQEDINLMKRTHSLYIKKQITQLERDFWEIAYIIYAEALQFYVNAVAFEQNKELYNETIKLIEEAKLSLQDILKRPVLVIRDLQNPTMLKAYSLEKAYRSVMQEALTYNNLSNDLKDIALKRTETQLFDSGVRYALNNSNNSVKDIVNATQAIRFNVLDSIKGFIGKLQKIMGKQFGANGLELSAHLFPAPDHAPAQGHQFTFAEVEKMQNGEDFEDVNGNKYVGFVRNIGEWNCRHYFMQIKLGSKPEHSQKELDKILEENERGYTDENGKHRTLYECTQVQRRYEREIRKSKEKYLYAKALKDKNMMANARNRVGKLTTQYKQFSRKCDIPAKLERIKVKDYE